MCAGTGDLMVVTDYLKCLNKSEIYDLGLVLGLDYHRVVDFEEKYSSNRRFLDSVVVSWLQKKDKVKDVSWKALMEALRHPRLGHNGIATSIATDHGMDLHYIITLDFGQLRHILFHTLLFLWLN